MGPGVTGQTSSGDGHEKADSILASGTQSPSSERHYTVAEIAAMWNLGKDTVRRMFQSEPEILVLGDSNPRRQRRSYKTLRIPESVVERVHLKYSLYS